VAAVYQRHEFMAEREGAVRRWGAYVTNLKHLQWQKSLASLAEDATMALAEA
jgi:hypothetical protein